ncbi:MAG TPA: recombinase, partial [Ruminococcaceae bacterium]|nr:recombinase [Oscillospiraceae bacterium]
QNLEVPITGLMNDRFACRTSGDIRATFDTKRRNGEFIGAFAPYGYQKDPNNKNALVPDEEAARVVRRIFLWFAYAGM